VAASTENRHGTRYYRCDLDDGTGAVSLLFSGRTGIPGMEVGTRCYVEGASQLEDGRLVLWNPMYRLERREYPCHPEK
jgi:hypothetical protein